jgi:PKD repeat protein
MYYNRVSPLRFKGGAPDETQYWINQAKNDLNNGQINNAYTHLGYASHFLTDVGNPLHTGRELDQAKQGDLVYMNGIWVWVPHVHRWIHDDYEVYVNNYWNDYFFASAHSQDFYTKSYLATNDASDEAILVSNQAHNDVDELYLLIHNNPVTWRSESTRSINGRTAREITSSNVFKTATGANTLVLLDFLLKPLPNYSNLPNDPDVDHLFEDVNGDQVFDFRDVVDLFQNMEWMQLNEPHNLFNFDNDNQITYGDVVVLFQQVP